MRFRAVILFLMWGAPAFADAHLNSLDLRTETLGLEAVGRLDIDGRGFCTGVLVDNDLVLTAAHCLYNGDVRVDPRKITFRAGLRHGEAVAESSGRRAVVMAGYHPDDQDALRQLKNDVALLQLADSIPLATAAPFSTTRRVARGDRVGVVSYARGRSQTLAKQDSCRVTDQGSGVLALSCDVDFGSSGAPVFSNAFGRGRIVSIISRGYREGQGTVAFGMLVDNDVTRLRADLIAGRGVFPKDVVKGRSVRTGDARDVGGARFVRP